MNAPNFKGIIFEDFALTNIYLHGHDINMYMKMTRTSMPLKTGSWLVKDQTWWFVDSKSGELKNVYT